MFGLTGLQARLLVLAIVIGLLIGAVVWRKHDVAHWKGVGRTELTAEIKVAKDKADEETRLKQAAIKRQTKEVVHEVRKEPGSNAVASPYLRGVIDRLRDDQR